MRDFAQAELAPHALEWDAASHFPRDTLHHAGELGLGGVYVREDVGGSGLGRSDAEAIFERMICPPASADRRLTRRWDDMRADVAAPGGDIRPTSRQFAGQGLGNNPHVDGAGPARFRVTTEFAS